MFTTFTVKKAKEPKKIIKNLFITKQVLPKKSPNKKIIKKLKPLKKPRKKILYKTQKPKEPKIEPEIKIEKIEPKIENKIEPKSNNNNNKPLPKLPCNLFCIFHNQSKIMKNPIKKPEPLLQKKRLIDEETGNSIGRWNKDEHRKFIEAIIKYGNNWKDVQKYIDTRTSTQARSHAQKYFEKMKKNKYLKVFKHLNIENSDNFTNATIMQLHKLYGNKSKNEINLIVNKFINIESDNQKKKRRNFHPYIGNKKSNNSNTKKHNLDLDINESVSYDYEENNENVDNNNINDNNYNNVNQNKIGSNLNINNDNINNNEEIYENNNSQKNEEENNIFNNDFNEKQLMQSYKGDGIKYILNELVRNLSQNYCDYDPLEPKQKAKRKNTFGSFEENESNLYEDNLAYLNQYNISNNITNNNKEQNANINLVTKSRKNSVESCFRFNNDKNDMFIKYQGLDDAKLSFDVNEVIARNLFEDDKGIKI